MYCRTNHVSRHELCHDCKDLLEYANERIEKCPFIESKPTCLNCPVHCYEGSRRERIRVVMRHSGPRMLFRHPVLAVLHMVDGKRKAV